MYLIKYTLFSLFCRILNKNSTRIIHASAKSNYYDFLIKIIKLEKGEEYNDYTLKYSNDYKSCTCSANLLL